MPGTGKQITKSNRPFVRPRDNSSDLTFQGHGPNSAPPPSHLRPFSALLIQRTFKLDFHRTCANTTKKNFIAARRNARRGGRNLRKAFLPSNLKFGPKHDLLVHYTRLLSWDNNVTSLFWTKELNKSQTFI